MWKLEPGKAQERYEELLTQLPSTVEKDDVASRSFAAAENEIKGVGFLDAPRGIVILITCGASQCTSVDDATALAKRIREDVVVMSAEAASESTGTGSGLVIDAGTAQRGPATTHTGLASRRRSRLWRRSGSTVGWQAAHDPPRMRRADGRARYCPYARRVDGRGRQVALGWLAAGAALAGVPPRTAPITLDPRSGSGWSAPDRSVVTGLSDKVREVLGRANLPERGVPAVVWVTAKQNPFNVDAFYTQYDKAVSAKTAGERSRHMAAALVAAGAILHTLGDLGAPSRVRGDEAAHLEPLGAGPDDLGSRLERIAALAYGRLGVPAASRTITRPRLRDYFTSKDGGGLADVIERSYYSPNSCRARRVSNQTKPAVRPRPPRRGSTMAANRDEGTMLHDTMSTCLRAIESTTTCSSSRSTTSACSSNSR
jgi:hypothetical protein